MNPESESYAWKQLEEHAVARLRNDFASRVLRATRPVDLRAWSELEEHAAAQLRSGFADRVLRAVRAVMPAEIPSFFSQFALSAATVAVCMVAVVYLHDRNTRLEDERSLADWNKFAAETQLLDLGP